MDAHPKTKKWMRDSFRAQFQEMVLTSKEVKLEEAERACQAEEDRGSARLIVAAPHQISPNSSIFDN
jgi:hypothetical protein